LSAPRGSAARVVCFATQGSGHGDERRLRALLAGVGAEALPFDRRRKARSALRLLATLLRRRPDLVAMEGTGVAGGFAVLAARLLAGIPYVVSSGDAVGPYVGLGHRRLAPFAALYERLLCRLSAGFIGWSPYLVGRALTFGAPRAMTAAGWAPPPAPPAEREAIRRQLGIPPEAIVFGLVGSLEWNASVGYCYGHELARALLAVGRPELRVLIVGDGSGLERLRELAAGCGGRLLLPGRVPPESVPSYLAAIDVASLPQSVDAVGSFRYTTKISEYLAAGLPVATGQIPLAYDLDDGWLWRLPGEAPWDRRYLDALAALMRDLDRDELAARRRAVPRALPLFDEQRQRRQVAEFVADLLA
jgi:glycosyltransferase involved in cell wall biosynthesis